MGILKDVGKLSYALEVKLTTRCSLHADFSVVQSKHYNLYAHGGRNFDLVKRIVETHRR
jgi:hypothetical protein